MCSLVLTWPLPPPHFFFISNSFSFENQMLLYFPFSSTSLMHRCTAGAHQIHNQSQTRENKLFKLTKSRNVSQSRLLCLEVWIRGLHLATYKFSLHFAPHTFIDCILPWLEKIVSKASFLLLSSLWALKCCWIMAPQESERKLWHTKQKKINKKYYFSLCNFCGWIWG